MDLSHSIFNRDIMFQILEYLNVLDLRNLILVNKWFRDMIREFSKHGIGPSKESVSIILDEYPIILQDRHYLFEVSRKSEPGKIIIGISEIGSGKFILFEWKEKNARLIILKDRIFDIPDEGSLLLEFFITGTLVYYECLILKSSSGYMASNPKSNTQLIITPTDFKFLRRPKFPEFIRDLKEKIWNLYSQKADL